MIKFSISIILLTCSFNAVLATELKGNPEELKRFLHPSENIVTLRGEGKETAYSDKAIINLIITTEEDKLSDSLEKNSKLRAVVISTLTKNGFKVKDIKTSKFSTSPQFGWFGSSPSSFEIVNRMSISIFDEKQLQEIAKLSDKYKQIELSSTRYEHTKKDSFLLKVKKKALADVMKQKSFYEKSLGVVLVTRNFRDSNVGYIPTFSSDELAQKIMVTGSRIKRKQHSISIMAESDMSPQSFDEVEYHANIFVDFIVQTKK